MMESSLNKCKNFDENFKLINENIANAAIRSGRSFEDISLLAATKTVETEVINHAIDGGLKLIGENRVQEYLSKYDELKKDGCQRHFIGRLQTNKVKYITDKVSLIQSVDSVKLASEISRQCEKHGIDMDILLEVNIGSEESKGGISIDFIYEILDEIRVLPHIKVKGLMCIPPIYGKSDENRRSFLKMQEYYVDIATKKLDNVDMTILSMGMSGDYIEAIECGSNMVRIGSALFGERLYNTGG